MRFRTLIPTLALTMLPAMGLFMEPAAAVDPDALASSTDLSTDPVTLVGDGETITTVPTASTAYTAPATKVTDPNCVSAVKAVGGTATDLAQCTVTVQSSYTAATAPTSTDITAMRLAEPTLTTATASVRRCRTWRQWYTAASYHEQHIGKMCYDHVNVYVWPWGGYHRCGDWWGFGYTASDIKCYGQRVNDSRFQGGYFRQMWDSVHWSFLVQGFPVSFTRRMHTNIFPSGNITYHNN